MANLYCSIDVESDGPAPSSSSMLALGAAMFTDSGKLLDTLEVHLAPLLDAHSDPTTMKWWAKHQEAYDYTRKDLMLPDAAMSKFYWWVRELRAQNGDQIVTPIGFRVAYDAMFTWYYLMNFGQHADPFGGGRGATMLDLKSYAAGLLGMDYRQAVKRNFPKEWFEGNQPHSHVASEDALEQGQMFFKMRKHVPEIL